MPKQPGVVHFSIRLRNLPHDVLVVKGPSTEALLVLLAGKVVLSTREPLQIRLITLKLVGTLRLNWTDTTTTPLGTHTRPIKHDKRVYEHTWADFDITHPDLENHLGGTTPRSKSMVNLKKSAAKMLPPGNYSFPFSAVIEGSIPELVEGLPGCLLAYHLIATVDKALRFSASSVAKKHLRVIRTLTPDAPEISETVAVDNTWPKKVEYLISVPLKAVAVGLAAPVLLVMVPLLKGLKLGSVRIIVEEHYSYCGSFGPANTSERVLVDKTIPAPDGELSTGLDRWEVSTQVPLPQSLSKCTQDVDIPSHVKVRHKMRFTIGLINPDGHTSELRALLPFILYISPFIPIQAGVEVEPHSGASTPVRSSSVASSLNQHAEETIFNGDGSGASTPATGLVAPPLYAAHVHDRLYLDLSPVGTPLASGQQSPEAGSGLENASFVGFGMLPMGGASSAMLAESLRKLQLLRETNSEAGLRFGNRATFSLEDDEEDEEDEARPLQQQPLQPDYFSIRPRLAHPLLSPGVLSPVHISRANSLANLRSPARLGVATPKPGNWDTAVLSRVPSYTLAMKDVYDEDAVSTPVYEPPAPGTPAAVYISLHGNQAGYFGSAPLSSHGSGIFGSHGSSHGHEEHLVNHVTRALQEDRPMSRSSSRTSLFRRKH